MFHHEGTENFIVLICMEGRRYVLVVMEINVRLIFHQIVSNIIINAE